MKIASLAPAAALAAILAAPGVLADDTQASSMDAMRVVRDKDSGRCAHRTARSCAR